MRPLSLQRLAAVRLPDNSCFLRSAVGATPLVYSVFVKSHMMHGSRSEPEAKGLTAELHHPHPHLSLLYAEGPELNKVMSSSALMSRPDAIIPSSITGRRNCARQGQTVLKPSDPG